MSSIILLLVKNCPAPLIKLPKVSKAKISHAVNSGVRGQDARRVLKEKRDQAAGKRPSADLYGCAAMARRKHWEQRVGVVLARGSL